jgi:hypothetical protein
MKMFLPDKQMQLRNKSKSKLKIYRVGTKKGLSAAIRASGNRCICLSVDVIQCNSTEPLTVGNGDLKLIGPVTLVDLCLLVDSCANITLDNVSISRGSMTILRSTNVLVENCSFDVCPIFITDSDMVVVNSCIIVTPMFIDGSKHVWVENNVLLTEISVRSDGRHQPKVSVKNNVSYGHGIRFEAEETDQSKNPGFLTIENNLFINALYAPIRIKCPKRGGTLKLYCGGNVNTSTRKITAAEPAYKKKGNKGQIDAGIRYRVQSYNPEQTKIHKDNVILEAGAQPRSPHDQEFIDHVMLRR